MDLFITFALIIAIIRVLTRLNTQNELVALLTSGVKIQTLLRPFVVLSLFFVSLLYVNTQFFIPFAKQQLRVEKNLHLYKKKKAKRNIFVQHLTLKDKSTLLYQNYDPVNEHFFDAYWIKSYDEIYRIKYLSPKTKIPYGRYVDKIIRNASGKMKKIISYDAVELPEIRFNRKVLFDTIVPAEDLSLTALWKKIPSKFHPESEKESHIISVFLHKMLLPWLCLLAVLAPAPLCVRFSRYFPVFYIYAIGIFGLVATYILLNATSVLASRQVFDPFAILVLPFLLAMAAMLYRFSKIR